MSSMEELYDRFRRVLAGRPATHPWQPGNDGMPRFLVDSGSLEELIGIPIQAESGAETGRLAKAIDVWAAHELRRAGFDADEVWPRPEAPHVLPRELALFTRSVPLREREWVADRIRRTPKIAPSDARVLGRAYVKQVDVLIAQWARGPELLISTKSMVSSFRNNLANRFEEAYGDAKNLRGRFPLASMGFLFLLRSTAADETGTLDRAIDMLRKLRQEEDVYDATCLLLAEWRDPPDFAGVRIRTDLVPADLQAGPFLAALTEAVLERTPIDMHVAVREAREGRSLGVEEAEPDDAPE